VNQIKAIIGAFQLIYPLHIPKNVLDIPNSVLVTGGFLVLLVCVFIILFLMPGLFYLFRLIKFARRSASFKQNTDPNEFKKLFSKDKTLSHLWSEYEETLHYQYEEQDGQDKIIAVRSTIPSEAFFNAQYIVDTRLRTEFFKHLPGIYTGIGIIGTFYGLIGGLREFKTENPEIMRHSLTSLMQMVGDAFYVSAGAITAAMIVTLLEKWLLSSLYRRTEQIAHNIDANFESGAGEEYLSRLVNASEASASQSKILKDALVQELGDILRELTASQLSATRDSGQNIASAISTSIENSLKTPLDSIASVVKSASSEQSSSAVQLLNDVMVSFSQRLNDLFGGQINSINDLNKQTAEGMQDAINSLNSLIEKIENSSKRTTDDMAIKIANSIKAMEDSQASMNNQTQLLVEQMKGFIENSQAETQLKLQSSLETIGLQMKNIVETINSTQITSLNENRLREQAMQDRASGLIEGMSGTIETVMEKLSTATETMATSVASLSSATGSSIEKMNIGANKIENAASNFAAAGSSITGMMAQTNEISSKMTDVSNKLSLSAGTLENALKDYQNERQALSSLLSEVRSTVELARKEASITTDVLNRIESSATKLNEAQKEVDQYLDGVSDVLMQSNEAFRNSVTTALSKVNTDFHNKLSGAVALLSSTIQELEQSLASIPLNK
jgi:hypothetical protein